MCICPVIYNGNQFDKLIISTNIFPVVHFLPLCESLFTFWSEWVCISGILVSTPTIPNVVFMVNSDIELDLFHRQPHYCIFRGFALTKDYTHFGWNSHFLFDFNTLAAATDLPRVFLCTERLSHWTWEKFSERELAQKPGRVHLKILFSITEKLQIFL